MAITEWIRSNTGAHTILVGRTRRNDNPADGIEPLELKERKDSPLRRIAGMRSGAWFVSLAEAYQEQASPPYQRKFGWFSPGDLGHKCDFYLALRYLAVIEKRTTKARLQRIFAFGHERDVVWKKLAKDTGVSLIKGDSENYQRGQRWVQIPEFHIRGEFDDLIQHPDTGEIYILEIKTMNTDEWKELKSPKEDHIHQAQPYIYEVQKRLGQKIAGVMFLYENKNTQEVKTFVVPFNSKVWSEDTARLDRIVAGVESGNMPMRTPVKNERDCPFYWCCAGFDLSKYVRPPA